MQVRLVTEQQWDEFLDKLDFVQLTGRWAMLPLHWLDSDLPAAVGELAQDLASGLLEIREEQEDTEERHQQVEALCAEYRSRLAKQVVHLDARLCPPGSRVTLKHLDPADLGEGDCLITVGSWDRVGHLVAELASPGGDHTENVGESPVRIDPGELSYRHILLFPDKGTPSPRAFRSLCEKTLRQARGLGCKHFTITHLHLSQEGLADRFAAAELVSAVRQMLRDGPGTTVTILAFSHRNFQDYQHWFESLKDLTKSSESESGYERPFQEPRRQEAEGDGDVGDTLRQFAKRSTEFASEATASLTNWISSATSNSEERPVRSAWRSLQHREQRWLAELYLKNHEIDLPDPTEPVENYLFCLRQIVEWEVVRESLVGEEAEEMAERLRASYEHLGPHYPLTRYFQLLEYRLSLLTELESSLSLDDLDLIAEAWDDRALSRYLARSREDSAQEVTNPPVAPGGSRLSVD